MAGEVVEIGKHVAIAPLLPCRKCEWCARGRFSLCEAYDYYGSRRDVGYAEYVAAPLTNLIRLPEGVSFEAASLLEPASVILHGLMEQVSTDDDVVIIGVGPLGCSLFNWLDMWAQDASSRWISNLSVSN